MPLAIALTAAAATGVVGYAGLAVTGLLSGGFAAAVAALITSRAVAAKTATETEGLRAKLPAEVDSIAVQGAESAVLTMKAALTSAVDRIGQLEEERGLDRRRIAELEAKVDALRAQVDAAGQTLLTARQTGTELRHELDALVREQAKRR